MSDKPVLRPKDFVLDPIDLQLGKIELAEAQAWFTRFGGIWLSAKRVAEPSLFTSRAGAGSRVLVEQVDGGRDTQYFFISRKDQKTPFARPNPELLPPRETIGFLPEVAGTDIVYDLTDETLQGKCRPFVCDLTTVRCRVYALLPVQIEAIALTAAATPAGQTARVEFHDARGQRLQALLPFHFRIEADGKQINAGYYVTEIDGRFDFPPKLLADLPAGSMLTVRSQLTGREQNCTLR